MNEITRPAGWNAHVNYETKVSLYDRVSGGLIALLVIGLFLFAILLSIWWSYVPQDGKPVIIILPPWPESECGGAS